jgi:uncharacterized protein
MRGNTRSRRRLAQQKKNHHRIVDGASPFRLRVGRSPIHGFGVFALQAIPAHRKVIEYAGERISAREWRKRNRSLSAARSGARQKYVQTIRRRRPVYYFRLNRHWGVDGAVGGSGAELINHGCDPNIKSRKIRNHILYFSRRRIRPGEELTIDYRFRWRARRDPCHCGSPKCRGTINLRKRTRRAARRTARRPARR